MQPDVSVSHRGATSVNFSEATTDRIFAHLKDTTAPGAAVGIAVEGKVVYRKGFGLANMEMPLVLSPNVRMRIGSISKHFTSLAYLLLCERGQARATEPIQRYLPEVRSNANTITPLHLMGHISGLRDIFDVVWNFSGTGRASSSADLLRLYRRIEDINASPSIEWRYNNGAYLLLTTLIERTTDRSLEEVLRESLCEPLGLYDTLLRRYDNDFLPNCATLHMTTHSGEFSKSYLGVALAGEGGLVSTVDDLLRWLRHMNSPTVGNGTTWKLMKTPLVLKNGTSTGYGLGLITGEYRGVETLSHGGSVMGGNAHMLKVPCVDLDIVVIANRHDIVSADLVERVMDACIEGLTPLCESDCPLSEGTFHSPATGRLVQLFGKGGKQFASVDGWDFQVVRNNNGELIPISRLSFLKLTINLTGPVERPHTLHLVEFGNRDELLAVSCNPGTKEPDEFAGCYRSSAVDAELTFHADGLRASGPFGSVDYDLEHLAENIWRAKSRTPMPWGGILTFDSRKSSVLFFSPRTRALPFHRL
ncbi:MAG: beta-lactamase family protein [Gammaproteobacteria bacterium]|nr:beta-lactamase family protein [Gammaproteobacteria bacterium]